jgi:hypothetical protein
MAMNCTAFRTELDAAVEERKAPPPDLAAHLDNCRDPACHDRWDDVVLLEGAIARWRELAPSIDVANAVVAQLQSSAGRIDGIRPQVAVLRSSRASQSAGSVSRRTTFAPLAVILAAGALVLIVVLGLHPTGDAHDRFAVRHGGSSRVSDPKEIRTSPDGARPEMDVAANPGAAYVAYAQSATQIVTDAVVLTLGDREQMEDSRITPSEIGWDSPWPGMGEAMDSAVNEWLEAIPVEAPPS